MNVIKFARKLRHLKLHRLYSKLSAYTMVPEEQYVANLLIAGKAKSVPGNVIECGTWKGGMIAGIAKVLGNQRKYQLFDSFEGLPAAKDVDGIEANAWQRNQAGYTYYNNCCASEEDVKNALTIAEVTNYEITKGWFEDSLPRAHVSGGISLLRLDGDWYDSTMVALESFFPQLNIGGIMIVDDYFAWDGCALAVHEFLGKQKRSDRIRQLHGVAYVVRMS